MEPDLTQPAQNKLRILVIDDEKNIRATLSVCLEQIGCQVTGAASAESALAALAQQPYDLAFLDLHLREISGLDLIPQLLAEDPNQAIIIRTAHTTIDHAVGHTTRGR